MTRSAAAAPPAAKAGSLVTVYAVPNATAAATPLMTFSGSRATSITVSNTVFPSSSSSAPSNDAIVLGADFLTVIDSGMSRSNRSDACISFAAAANISFTSGSSPSCASASPTLPLVRVATNRARRRVARVPRVPARALPTPRPLASPARPPGVARVTAARIPRPAPARVRPPARLRARPRPRSINRSPRRIARSTPAIDDSRPSRRRVRARARRFRSARDADVDALERVARRAKPPRSRVARAVGRASRADVDAGGFAPRVEGCETTDRDSRVGGHMDAGHRVVSHDSSFHARRTEARVRRRERARRPFATRDEPSVVCANSRAARIRKRAPRHVGWRRARVARSRASRDARHGAGGDGGDGGDGGGARVQGKVRRRSATETAVDRDGRETLRQRGLGDAEERGGGAAAGRGRDGGDEERGARDGGGDDGG